MPRTGGAPTRASGIVRGFGPRVKGGEGRCERNGRVRCPIIRPYPSGLSCARVTQLSCRLLPQCFPLRRHSPTRSGPLPGPAGTAIPTPVATRIADTTSSARVRCSARRFGNRPSSGVIARDGTRSFGKQGPRHGRTTRPSVRVSGPRSAPSEHTSSDCASSGTASNETASGSAVIEVRPQAKSDEKRRRVKA